MITKKEYEKQRYQKIKNENYEDVDVICKVCGGPTTVKKYQLILNKNYRKKCNSCISKQHSENFTKTRAKETPLERRDRALKAHTFIDRRNGVLKSWETIKANPEKYAKAIETRKRNSKKLWNEVYSDETKKKILDSLLAGKNCVRSKVCQDMKNKMEESGIKGFLSEQFLKGFYPDEIDFENKIIVEMYGDIYHCNPKKYKDPNEYLSYINRTVGEQWYRDRRRLAAFYKYGYDVIIVWESDWYSNPDAQIERIKNEINRKKEIKSEV